MVCRKQSLCIAWLEELQGGHTLFTGLAWPHLRFSYSSSALRDLRYRQRFIPKATARRRRPRKYVTSLFCGLHIMANDDEPHMPLKSNNT